MASCTRPVVCSRPALLRDDDFEAGIDRHVDIERAGERLSGKKMQDWSGVPLSGYSARRCRLMPTTFRAAGLHGGRVREEVGLIVRTHTGHSIGGRVDPKASALLRAAFQARSREPD